MPSVVEIMKRKVDKDDPVYGKLDNLKKMIDEQTDATDKLDDVYHEKIEGVGDRINASDERVKRLEALVIAMG